MQVSPLKACTPVAVQAPVNSSSLISNLTQVSEVASAEVFHPEMPIEVQVFRPTSIYIILYDG